MGNNTDLKGAVIASEADDTRKNRLDTGTISFSDIENKADFNVTHVSVSGGTSGPGMPTAYQNSDSASSTTKSAVEQGQLIIRNQDKQQQNIADLSRDTESANNPLKQIFDKQKELDKIETVELIKDIAQQAKSITQKYDRIQAQKDLDNNKDKLDKLDAAAKEEAIKEQARAEQDPNYQPKSYDEIYAQYYHDEVDNIVINNAQKNLGTMGSDVSKGIDTATAIITGIITGDITGGLAGASAPWLAEQIKLHTGHMGEDGKWQTDDIAGNLIAHAILGAVVAELQGNSGLAGGAGAVAGEVAADIIRKQLYGKEVKDLTEEEKQTISALSQLAAGLAVAAGGGSVGDAGAAISSSKNAVENNFFAPAIPLAIVIGESVGTCFATGPCIAIVAGVATAVGYEIIQENSDNNSSNNELNNSEATAVGSAPILPPDDDNNKKNENNQKQRQQERFDELKDVFDKDNPKTDLTIDGQLVRQNGGNRYTTRIYDSQNLTDRQIYNYAEELAGQPLTKAKEGVYTTRLQDGTSITLRNVSHSAEKTGARWTIEITNNPTLANLYRGLRKGAEIKFR